MGTHNPVPGSSAKTESDSVVKWLLSPISKLLCTGQPAATIDRLFVSQHVTDLRLIIAFALVTVVTVFVVGVPLSLANVQIAHLDWGYVRVTFSALGSFLTFFTPVLGVFGAVLAWAYQAGSARLGIVDLYACEIDTLCRVATVVDSVRRWTEVFQHGLPGRDGGGKAEQPTRHFTSQENYFPVFENNTRDLQALEARVVINITAFYTYMKAVRDSMRTLMDMPASPAQPTPGLDQAATSAPWQEVARNVIYMMFLGLESGRKAIEDLVEFEPESAERRIVILISELEAYRFLCGQYVDEEDIRHRRLVLRDADYRDIVPTLCQDVENGRLGLQADGRKSSVKPFLWEPALRLLPELNRRYDAAINRSLPPRRSVAVA